MPTPRFERLLSPFYALLDAVLSGRRSPVRHVCAACGTTDFPRVDYANHQMFCRHCGEEIRWWLKDA